MASSSRATWATRDRLQQQSPQPPMVMPKASSSTRARCAGPHSFPGLARGYARRAAKHADLRDPAVRLGGSHGDQDLRELRERFEALHATR
jgi:hypothetical protein